jgi:hypothetical protein
LEETFYNFLYHSKYVSKHLEHIYDIYKILNKFINNFNFAKGLESQKIRFDGDTPSPFLGHLFVLFQIREEFRINNKKLER